jgi:hypothetical protein
MNIFKINDVIIKMDNYEHQIGWGRFIRSCHGQSMP